MASNGGASPPPLLADDTGDANPYEAPSRRDRFVFARQPTARSNASTALCWRNGPTPAPTGQRPNDATPFPPGLHTCNHHCGHTALKGRPPASRVPDLTGQNT
ncbi:hypothetical protein GCM10027176_02280 [Actinoallomurus bryophytorum]